MRRMIFDTGFNKDTIEKILDRFAGDNKVIYRDEWIAIKNFIKHQKENPKIQRGIEIILKGSPQDLVKWIQDDSNIEYRTLSHLNTNTNNNINTNMKKKEYNNTGAEAKECLDCYFATHKEVRGYEPTIVGGRDMKLFKTLLKNYDVPAVKEVIHTFFGWDKRSDFTTRALYNRFDVLYGVLKDKAEGKR